MKEYDEIWAVDADRIRAFFKDNEDVKVIPMQEKRVGPLALPQTRIIISGDNAQQLYHEFYLHFIAAGG